MIRNLAVSGPEELLRQERYPVWFFTNEHIAHVWNTLPENPKSAMFGVAGAGDWALNAAASGKTGTFHLVDNRPLALITLEIKFAFLRLFDREQFRFVVQKPGALPADTLERLANLVSQPTLAVFTALVQQYRGWNRLFRVRKLWYPESWHALRQDNCLAYLHSDKAYARAGLAVDRMILEYGSIQHVLASAGHKSFGLMYCSNLLDSKRYVPEPRQLLINVRDALAEHGTLLCMTQHAPKKLQCLAESLGFQLVLLEHHPFRLLQSLRGLYQYSILAFQA